MDEEDAPPIFVVLFWIALIVVSVVIFAAVVSGGYAR
jgi:hypothetical protein